MNAFPIAAERQRSCGLPEEATSPLGTTPSRHPLAGSVEVKPAPPGSASRRALTEDYSFTQPGAVCPAPVRDR